MDTIFFAQKLRDIFLSESISTIEFRKKKIRILKEKILKFEDAILEALKLDLGKSNFEAYSSEVGFILEDINFNLKNIEKWASRKKVKTPLILKPGKSFIYPEPYGVVLIISPWNYPFQLALAPLIGAFLAGNKIVLKPSELSPNTSKIIKKLLEEVFNGNEIIVIEGGLEEAQLLLKQKWDYIFFTGSTSIGKVVMKAAAESLTPVTLELGGKSPCIIEKSADLDLAAKRCVWGKFMNSGQTCVAPDFVLVPNNMKDKLIEKLIFYIEKFYGKDASNSEDYSRIVNHYHFLRLIEMIDPHKLAYGGSYNESNKYISPTLLTNVTWHDRIMETEIFGPILPILGYDSLEEIYKELLIRPKPLALYFFSEDKKLTNEALKRLSFGGGCINDTILHLANPALPFGGIGESGVGRYHGEKSFETFSHFKSVFEQSTFIDIPIRYPPFGKKTELLKFFLN